MLVLLVLVFLCTNGVESRKAKRVDCFEYSAINCRAQSASLVGFGGVVNMKHLSQYESQGGSQLFVPAGKWLTESFNLTSHFTLYLHKDAVLASQVKCSLCYIDQMNEVMEFSLTIYFHGDVLQAAWDDMIDEGSKNCDINGQNRPSECEYVLEMEQPPKYAIFEAKYNKCLETQLETERNFVNLKLYELGNFIARRRA
ncbi:hypothetical protein OROMI_005535 [Orobanche minor]